MSESVTIQRTNTVQSESKAEGQAADPYGTATCPSSPSSSIRTPITLMMLVYALHREGNLFPCLIYRQHPDTDDVADLYDVERMLHKSVREL